MSEQIKVPMLPLPIDRDFDCIARCQAPKMFGSTKSRCVLACELWHDRHKQAALKDHTIPKEKP